MKLGVFTAQFAKLPFEQMLERLMGDSRYFSALRRAAYACPDFLEQFIPQQKSGYKGKKKNRADRAFQPPISLKRRWGACFHGVD